MCEEAADEVGVVANVCEEAADEVGVVADVGEEASDEVGVVADVCEEAADEVRVVAANVGGYKTELMRSLKNHESSFHTIERCIVDQIKRHGAFFVVEEAQPGSSTDPKIQESTKKAPNTSNVKPLTKTLVSTLNLLFCFIDKILMILIRI